MPRRRLQPLFLALVAWLAAIALVAWAADVDISRWVHDQGVGESVKKHKAWVVLKTPGHFGFTLAVAALAGFAYARRGRVSGAPAAPQGPRLAAAPEVRLATPAPASHAGDSRAGDSRAGDSRAGDSRAGDSRAGDSRATRFVAANSFAAPALAGGYVLASGVLAGLFYTLAKWCAGRTRPFKGPPAFEFHPFHGGPRGLLVAENQAFPSGHACLAFATAAALATLFPRGRWLFYAAAAFTAAERVLEGAHYPSDVVGGAALGVLAAACLSRPFFVLGRRAGQDGERSVGQGVARDVERSTGHGAGRAGLH